MEPNVPDPAGSVVRRPDAEQETPRSPAARVEQELPTLNGYEIVDVLGRGGMGIVYEGYQRSTGRRVAIKFMLNAAAASDAARRRFEREVELVARLQHPGIVSVLDSGVHQGRYYYVMEFVDGRPLDRWIADGGPRIADGGPRITDCNPSRAVLGPDDRREDTPARMARAGSESGIQNPKSKINSRSRIDAALRLMGAVCDAVDYAHQRGVLHRDLKPSNILVVEQGLGFRVQGSESARGARAQALNPEPRTLNPQPKILDFGLAKTIDPDAGLGRGGSSGAAGTLTLSEPGQLIGTLGYMSPEQARGDVDQISVRSDVYSLGAIAYELMAGKPPCSTDGPLGEVLNRIAGQDPVRPSVLRRGTPADVDAILLKALEKQPERRYATAGELGADLHRFLNHEAITARPTSAWYQFRKFAQRNRALVVGALATNIALLLGITGTSWQAIRASSAEGRALKERDDALTARKMALRSAEASEAVANFLPRILGVGTGPRQSGDTRLRDLLDAAAQRVETELADRPAGRSTVHGILGLAYQGLGLHAQAEVQLRRSLDVQETGVQDDALNKFVAMNNLAGSLYEQRRLVEAEEWFARALAGMRSIANLNPADTAWTRQVLESTRDVETCLIRVRMDLGRPNDAEPLARSDWEADRRSYGEEDKRTLGSMIQLAWVLEKAGWLEEAESLDRRALEARQRKLGNQHLQTISAMYNLGTLLRDCGKVEEAERVLCDVLAQSDQNPSISESSKLLHLVAYGSCLTKLGRYKDAEARLVSGLTRLRAKYGAAHRRVREVVEMLIELYDAWHAAEPDMGYDQKAEEWRCKPEELNASLPPPASQPAPP